jgi:hypothetical protein
LRSFRKKFGRGWDQEGGEEEEGLEDGKQRRNDEGKGGDGWGEEGENLMDLISGQGQGWNEAVLEEREVGSGTGEGREKKEQKMVTVKQNGVLVKVPSTKKK